MRKIALSIAGLLTVISVSAQTTSGKVYYDEHITSDINLNDQEINVAGISAEQLSALIPKEHTKKSVLLFTPDASLYEPVKEKVNEDVTQHQNGVRIMVTDDDERSSVVYRDIVKKQVVEQRDFMSRKFLITTDEQKSEWKMTGKQMEILGYPCQQAIMQKDTQQIVAWFTPAIPVASGPSAMGGLPGLILKYEAGGNYTVTATKVEAGQVDKKQLVKPTDGKKISNAQFNAIVQEKMKELHEQSGGRNVIMKFETH